MRLPKTKTSCKGLTMIHKRPVHRENALLFWVWLVGLGLFPPILARTSPPLRANSLGTWTLPRYWGTLPTNRSTTLIRYALMGALIASSTAWAQDKAAGFTTEDDQTRVSTVRTLENEDVLESLTRDDSAFLESLDGVAFHNLRLQGKGLRVGLCFFTVFTRGRRWG